MINDRHAAQSNRALHEIMAKLSDIDEDRGTLRFLANDRSEHALIIEHATEAVDALSDDA